MQFWRQVYLLMVLSLILAVFCAQVHPRYLSNDWRRIRVTIFCCVAGISVIPACHWVWLNGGFGTDVVQVRKYSDGRKQAKWEWADVCSCYVFTPLYILVCSFLKSVPHSWISAISFSLFCHTNFVFIMCAAVPASCDSDVPDCWICLPVLRHQDPWTLFPWWVLLLSLSFSVYRSEVVSLKPTETLGHQKKNSAVKVTVSMTVIEQ